MRFLNLVVMLLGLASHGTAQAQCAKIYGAAAFGADITAMHKALQADDRDTLVSTGQNLAEGLPCTNIVPPVPALASAYRFIGVHHAIALRKAEAERFFRTALELDPNFEWGVNELASSPDVRSLFEGARDQAMVEPVRIEGKAFTPPAGSSVYVDGRKAKHVEATLERPHLVQVVSNDSATATHIVDGNVFPEELVGEAQDMAAARAGAGGPVRVQRLRPPAKTPLLVVGGVGLVAGAGLYAASMASRSSFDSAKTTEELLQYKSTTNALVVASASAAIVGLGSGYAGFILSGQPGIVVYLSY